MALPTARFVAAALTAGLLALTGATAGTAPALAQEAVARADSQGVSVGGLGTVTGTPDLLRMQMRIVAVRPTAAAALSVSSTVAGRVRTALRQHAVAPADIQTTQLNVSPSYAGRPAKLVGYQVVQGLTALLRDVPGAGSTITDVVRVGGTALRFDGVFFTISDTSPLQDRARDRAFAQARAKAEQYARLSGRSLGALQSVTEDLLPFYYEQSGGDSFRSGAALAADGYVVNPGVQRVDVRVVARWALLPAA